ncbi:MAG: sortase [Spirochaetota bacterium]
MEHLNFYAENNIIEEEQPIEITRFNSEPAEKSKVEYTPIAKMEIEKIGLELSVLSEWSYRLLEISVNKLRGPEPNEPGNFIVIGYNYLNGIHFGSLNLLKVGDLIDLTDLSGRTIIYEVYEILIVKPEEVEKLETDKALTLTLVTCDTKLDYRLVVKSKATDL